MGLRLSLSTANSAHEGADPKAKITQMLVILKLRRPPSTADGAHEGADPKAKIAQMLERVIRSYACNVAVNIIVVGQIAPARVPREP